MLYYGTRLSENMSVREPEGYLFCCNVPVARTGWQEYLPGELGLPPGQEPVRVYRPEEEVFSPKTMASFEGMPVTNDHPEEGVDIGNVRFLQKGHAQHIRRGEGAESDLLLADLLITDARLKEAILAGKREISCGYTYELREENGRYVQRKIRGNHVAVVDAGRAGPRVSIKDRRAAAPAGKQNGKTERRKGTMTIKKLSKALARLAMDGKEDEAAEMIEELLEENAGGTAEAAPAEGTVTVEVPEDRVLVIDEESFSGLLKRMDDLIAALGAMLKTAPEHSSSVGDEQEGELSETAEEVAEIIEEVMAGETDTEAGVSEEQEENGPGDCDTREQKNTQDTLRAVVRGIRPCLAKMPLAERRKASRDIAVNLRGLRGASDRNVYAALAAGRSASRSLKDLGARIMSARNVNYKK